MTGGEPAAFGSFVEGKQFAQTRLVVTAFRWTTGHYVCVTKEWLTVKVSQHD